MTCTIKLDRDSCSFFETLKKEWNLKSFDEVASRIVKRFEEETNRQTLSDLEKEKILQERKDRIAKWKAMLASGHIDTKSKIYQEHIQSIEEMKKDKEFMKEQQEWLELGVDDGIE